MKKFLLSILSIFSIQIALAQTKEYTDGFFIVNEDWFGHADGSVNFINVTDSVDYNVYKTVNNGEELGVTTQFGTIYGDNFYFVSKQGSRLIVANAKTLKKKASFETIGADGRTFLGVDTKTGYIGTSKGIYLFDIENLKLGALIEGTDTAGQIGNMARTSKDVFVASQKSGILILDPKTNKVKQSLSGTYFTLVQTKDGYIWAHATEKITSGTTSKTQHQLVKINPITYEITKYNIPTKTLATSWGAWNAGSLTASAKEDALYFVSGTSIVKFDTKNGTFDESFAQIPGQNTTPKQTIYGAGLRVDPLTDELILTTIGAGWGTNSEKNFVHTLTNKGVLSNTIKLSDYYWFPALTVFPDIALPVLNNLDDVYNINTPTTIDLKDKVSDEDNLSVAIVKNLEIIENDQIAEVTINENDELVINPLKNGTLKMKISFNSNGKSIDKIITVHNSVLGIGEVSKTGINVYPNPVRDILFVESNEVAKAEIYSVVGNKIMVKTLDKGKNQLDVSSLSKGVYILKINNSTFKVIKK